MKTGKLLPFLSVLLLRLAATGSAHANTISGIVYCNVSATDASNTPAPGASVSGTECATFQTSAINFTANSSNTIGGFLNSNSSILGTISYLNGFSASSNLDYSVFQFTGAGWFTNGQQYSATHDDGTVMTIGGLTVINAPLPTSAITNTFIFSGATGRYNYQYDFSEVQGATVYSTNATPDPVPEPASLLLLGTGLLGAGALTMRRHRTHLTATA